MFKTTLLIGFIFSTMAAFAGTSLAEDHIKCTDVLHITRAAEHLAGTRTELESFSKGVCASAPLLCPQATEMVASIQRTYESLAEMKNVVRQVCQ